MELTFLDISLFIVFFIIVVGVSIFKSRKEETGEDYFLASRGLIWPIIGLSLIAANISSEQFVGMSGQSAGSTGLAISSYEWMAAITLVFVAIFFLPKFLKSGIYTMPEFLEYRYSPAARSLMAFYMMVIYVGVTISAVLYSGAIALATIFDMNLLTATWLIGCIAAVYTTWGGLKAVAWADLFQGSALILGGALTLVIGLYAVGGVDSFFNHNSDKLHMILPADHPVLPWTALVIGLWIPNFYYWGLNQYITQKTLASKSLRHGQMGIIFAAFIKLTIPFIIVFPGIIAHQLYAGRMTNTDAAYPLLIRNLMPVGIRGFIFAAISGAIISTLSSMLNSASTIFSIDLYKRHINKEASSKRLVTVGRITTVILMLIGCIIAPNLGNERFKGIFNYIQEFQGFVSPGILAAFVVSFIFKKAPNSAGITALILSPVLYGIQLFFFADIAFLNRMAITFIIIVITAWIITMVKPLEKPKEMPVRQDIDMKPDKMVAWLGAAVIVITLVLYGIFW